MAPGTAAWERIGHARLGECPGCGLELPAGSAAGGSSGEGLGRVSAGVREVAGFASEHLSLLRLHQLTVDAYGAQHGGGGVPPIRSAYGLVGLCLALEHGLTGDDVRSAHQRMGKPDLTWPAFPPPRNLGSVTVMTVAEEGLMSSSESGHHTAVRRWAEKVWRAWWDEHAVVAALAHRLLPDLALR